ncbi:baseplate J/gp47 family protein [Deinococcus kurensis]|uniref:baseplate J/gp47 family protein n=1 Tax=Deinococcus kurensis TaxID=2662757 RepID=UPI0012D2F56F|nr:baseplate J/gp47 family protein [Deinococcus kurensis]
MTLIQDDTPRLDGLSLDLGNAPRVGQLAIHGLGIAAARVSQEGVQRGVPELTAPGYDSPHVALLEGFAGIAAQVLYRANVIPAALQVQMYEAAGLPRKGPQPAEVDVFVDNPNPEPVNWVEGSLVGAGRTVFELVRSVVVPAEAKGYGPVPLRCLERGPIGNIMARHGGWSYVTAVALGGISNPQPANGGTLGESEDEYLGRTRDIIAGRGSGNSREDFEALALAVDGIQRTKCLEHTLLRNATRWGQFRWNYADWGATKYADTREGAITVIARPYGGGPLSSEMLGRLMTSVDPAKATGGHVYYASPEEILLDFYVKVKLDGTRSFSVVQADIERRIREWCDGSTWPWGGVLRESELRVIVGNVPGVDLDQGYDAWFLEPGQTDVWAASERVAVTDPSGQPVPGDDGAPLTRVSVMQPLYPNVLFHAGSIQVDPPEDLI